MLNARGDGGPAGPLDGILLRVFELARPYLQTRKNDLHTRICYAYATELLGAEPGDPALVLPAVLLHDVGWSQVPEEEQLCAFGPTVTKPELTRLHEREGARIAAEILRTLHYSEDAIVAIAVIVDGHDTRLSARSPEDAVVKDSDKLFRFSRDGFFIDVERFSRQPDEYLRWLEAQVDRWFFSATAKRIARDEVEARGNELRRGV